MYFNLLFTEQRHRLDGFIEPDLCARSYSPAIKGRRLIPAAFKVVAPHTGQSRNFFLTTTTDVLNMFQQLREAT